MYLKLQHLLGENISKAEILDLAPIRCSKNMFYISSESYLFGYSFNHIAFFTNEDNTIEIITINLNGIINKTFYESISRHLGVPVSIQVVEYSEEVLKKTNVDGLVPKTIEKRFIKTRNGIFEEKPLYIIWEKENLQVKVLIKYDQNSSEITFRTPMDNF